MIRGNISAHQEAAIPLDVAGPNRQWQRLDAVIDTGFNGSLTLPLDSVRALRLPLVGNRLATLGDGTVVALDVYLATVLWHERERDVLVLQADNDPLVGMSLLYGSRVTLNIVNDGDVIIDELPDS